MAKLFASLSFVLFLVAAIIGAVAFGGILIGALAITALVAGFSAVIVWAKQKAHN